ncbi:tetratricopeptide repeat-containing sulfotransferase family protein [Halioglobus pacificus]|uniref:Sulfotransferase n=1 Tax=Parahalioglobus pacificus TaxID=930806 RepID=A0A918XKM9_9GAMM|nr:tetratricopeptide repeat-containing sulfotransferase family protein [Halioglobus pacificus]GHD35253.1 sulfotransferase [Halioglobus pacificus]
MTTDRIRDAERAHQSGDLTQAEQLYRAALADTPDNASVLYGLGTLLMQSGDLENAGEHLASAQALEPDAADIAFNLALCRQQQQRTDEAVTAANKAAKLAAGDEGFSCAIADLLLGLGQAQEAAILLQACPMTQAATASLMARALTALGQWDGAVSLYRQLCAQHPDQPELLNALAVAAGHLRDYPLAIESFERYMGLVTPSAADHVRFADLYLLARRLDACRQQLALAENLGATDGQFHLLCARVARLSGDDEGALVSAKKAVLRDKALGQAWSILAELLPETALPKLAVALKRYRDEATTTDYNRQLMSYALAEASRRSDDYSAAAQALREANGEQLSAMTALGTRYDPKRENNRLRATIASYGSGLATAPSSQRRPLFIVGMPRSGTTLIERVLAGLPTVQAGGESDALGFVAAHYEREQSAGRLPEPAQMTSQQWQALADQYWQLNPADAAVLTDKMPHNYLHVGLALSLFPEARVLQMRRDPRAIALSIYFRPFPADHNYACDPNAIAHAWQTAHGYMDHWAGADPDRVIDVDLATFAQDPEGQGQRLAEFCDLEWQSDSLAARQSDQPSFTFSERQVRSAITSDHLDDWRKFADVLPELFAPYGD